MSLRAKTDYRFPRQNEGDGRIFTAHGSCLAFIGRISFIMFGDTVISSILPERARQSLLSGTPCGEGRAPGPRGRGPRALSAQFSMTKMLKKRWPFGPLLVDINNELASYCGVAPADSRSGTSMIALPAAPRQQAAQEPADLQLQPSQRCADQVCEAPRGARGERDEAQ